jgi:thiol-disulfide isomerase/thioredoxin
MLVSHNADLEDGAMKMHSSMIALALAAGVCGAANISTVVGKPAPVFRLPNQNSATPLQFSLPEHLSADSAHAVIVSFFAQYCNPCRVELPILQKMADSLAGSGLRWLRCAWTRRMARSSARWFRT